MFAAKPPQHAAIGARHVGGSVCHAFMPRAALSGQYVARATATSKMSPLAARQRGAAYKPRLLRYKDDDARVDDVLQRAARHTPRAVAVTRAPQRVMRRRSQCALPYARTVMSSCRLYEA